MELDHLINNLKKPEQDSKIYLAIEIGLETIKTAIWEIKSGKTKIIHLGSVEEVNTQSAEELLEAVDISVTKAQENAQSEPREVIFSLPESWIKSGDIDRPKKRLLKTITDKLVLKPIGFVVTVEALVHFLGDRQAGPINTILLGLTETDVVVTIVENGKIQGTQVVGRSDDLGADVEEGIARFGAKDSLPSSMVLYDGHTDLESQKQILISYNWQDHLPFLHIPKIDHLEISETIEAAIFSAGSEVIASNAQSSVTSPSPEPEIEVGNTIPDMSAQFGFHSASKSSAPVEPDSLEESNFVVHDQGENIHDNLMVPEDPDKNTKSNTKNKPNLGKTLGVTKGFLKKLKLGGLKNIFGTKIAVIGSVVAVLILLLASAGAYALYQLPTAQITLLVKPDAIDTEISFTIDPNATEVLLDEMIIGGKVQTVDVTGTKSAPVTGEKLVGEQAKGTVTIYNRTNSVKTFTAGTKLTGPDNLAYTLSDDVSIASASTKENPDFSITTEPASKSVAVSATSIGAKYNLGSGTEFKVANFDSTSFIARASTDLTGGTSRQITAVSQDDHDNLESAIIAELKTKAASQVNQTSVGNAVSAIPITSEEEEKIEIVFSAKVGEETATLTGNAKLSLEIMTYKKSDLTLLVEKLVAGSVAGNKKIQTEATTLDVTKSVYDPETKLLSVAANAKAKASPIIKPDDIRTNVTGRYPALTETYFKSLPNYQDHKTIITPEFLPGFIKTFPRKLSNINVTIETAQ